MQAQTLERSDDVEQVELRKKIGIDYSMPDFSTSRIDGKVIGERLAKMLKKLEDSGNDYVFSQRISIIQAEQIDDLNYVKVEKFSVNRISKAGDVITIKAKTKLAPNSAKIKNAEVAFIFYKGISESISVNDLFSDLNRYIKD